MAKKQGITYEEIVRQVRAGEFKPIYYLMGDEPYYIDRLSDFIVDNALSEEEKDFNLTILYGSQTDGNEVVNAAKRYPMMAERQVVVVREAQALDNPDPIGFYAQKPMLSTILVFCHKGGKLDKRTKMSSEIAQVGVIFESLKLYESQLPTFVQSYLRRKNYEIQPSACYLLCDYIGSDLNRMAHELDKLIISMSEAQKTVTPQDIENNIGISKDYNAFELTAALGEKNIQKAARIIKYFDSNPKNFALQPTLATMFNFFSNLMLAYYSPVKTVEGIAVWVNQTTWQVRNNIMPALRLYKAGKVFQIISEIRRVDGASKGVGGERTSDGDLLKELVFFILH
ncbi:MAG: DNA polymerase III subunit delta [Bacteroidaceae bacterium]|nr:DNA polymerase III subunit delta [Bacteroidaceae bacterium]